MSTLDPRSCQSDKFVPFGLLKICRTKASVAPLSPCDGTTGAVRRLDGMQAKCVSYVRLAHASNIVQLATRLDPALACWAALVNGWEGVESPLEEIDKRCNARNAKPVTSVRPFG